MKQVVIIGAGGHSRSVFALLERNGFEIKGFYDSSFSNPETIFGVPILGPPQEISPEDQVILAIGDNKARSDWYQKLNRQIHIENIFHPSALVEKYTKLGTSNLIFANCFINNGVEVGDNNLINTAAILEHEVSIGSHTHISVGAILLGRSAIGNHCFVGAGATIRERIRICDQVTIGAHSYVAEDITQPGVYVGSPARKIK
jgi:sugar O-acyltransferase (sialic acid O-acetyltransferase NeuD family)